MPEGHTLHRLARDLRDTFGGDVVGSSSPQGRFAESAARVDGHRLESAAAWGKHLFVELAGLEEQVHVHLGLYGKFRILSGRERPVVGQVRWRLESPRAYADLRGATACELLDPAEVDAVIARLGPDPLRADADPERGWRRISTSRSPVAALLMDQSVLAGVGNVYRAEVLFRHGVDPFMEGRYLRRAEWDLMWADLVELMHDGVERRRIDTLRPEHDPCGILFDGHATGCGGGVYVYKRTGEECRVCGATVRTKEIVARNLFWCPECQRRSRRRTATRVRRAA